MKRYKILQCVSHLDLGGAEQVAWSLAAGLQSDFDFSFHAVRGIAPTPFGKHFYAQLSDARLPLTVGPRVPMRRGGLLTGAWSLLRSVKSARPDLIHTHAEIAEAAVAFARLFSPSLRRIPVVRTIHNSKIWHFARPLGSFCEKRLADAACVAVSNSARQALRDSRALAGLPPESASTRVIYNGLAVPKTKSPQGLRENETVRCVFGGRFEHEKGFDLLPAILDHVSLPSGRHCSLDLFGHGVLQEATRHLLQAPPTGWSVQQYPPIPDLRERLCEYHVALVPSRFEGLSLFAIEALLAGLVVVATDAPGLNEALPPDYPLRARADDAVDFARQLTRALATPQLWLDSSREAREVALAKFSVSRMLDDHRSLYHALLPSPRA
jgi:glycosyltransferase involved in cell wall biosynthesis